MHSERYNYTLANSGLELYVMLAYQSTIIIIIEANNEEIVKIKVQDIGGPNL